MDDTDRIIRWLVAHRGMRLRGLPPLLPVDGHAVSHQEYIFPRSAYWRPLPPCLHDYWFKDKGWNPITPEDVPKELMENEDTGDYLYLQGLEARMALRI